MLSSFPSLDYLKHGQGKFGGLPLEFHLDPLTDRDGRNVSHDFSHHPRPFLELDERNDVRRLICEGRTRWAVAYCEAINLADPAGVDPAKFV
jgi:hypothetical protein